MFLQDLKHKIPNLLTLLRLVLAFSYPFIDKELRIPVIIISILTEFFDGYLARKWKVDSKLGALLDPIADKCFVFSVALMMFIETELTWWLFMLFGFRDLVVLLGAIFLAIEKNWKPFFNVKPRIPGKVATSFQFAFLLSVLYFNELNWWILYPTIVLSIAAGLEYLYLLKVNNFYREN